MKTTMKRINSLDRLQAKKQRLEQHSRYLEQKLAADAGFVKEEYLSSELLYKASASVVPAAIRHSHLLNDPINFIADRLFGKERKVVNTHSDHGRGNEIRNVALAVLEGACAYFLYRLLRRKLLSEHTDA
jgi:hypothetical protein